MSKTVEIDKIVDLLVDKEVNATVDLVGSLATAAASADAIGFDNVLAQTDTFAQVSELGAFTFSGSLAAGHNNVVTELGAIGDFVFLDADQDRLQGAAEPGIEGVDVILLDADGTTVLETTTTDADGAYLFDNLAAGTYVSEFPQTIDFNADGIPDLVSSRQPGEIDRTADAGYREGSFLIPLADAIPGDAEFDTVAAAGELAVDPPIVDDLILSWCSLGGSSVATDGRPGTGVDGLRCRRPDPSSRLRRGAGRRTGYDAGSPLEPRRPRRSVRDTVEPSGARSPMLAPAQRGACALDHP